MTWYYVENEKSIGPVSTENLNDLFKNRQISPYTLVWNKGLQGWIPYNEAFQQKNLHVNLPFCQATHKPLENYQKLGLILSVVLKTVIFYLFLLISSALLISILAAEAVLFIALTRFGCGSMMIQLISRHIAYFIIIIRSLLNQRTLNYRIDVSRIEAPQLFKMIDNLCQKIEIAAPKSVHLEMSLGAWVKLDGMMRESSKTALGLGYDLLVLLDQRELESVLAHEMAHAKLIRRGFRRWMMNAGAHSQRLAQAFVNVIEKNRREKETHPMASFFYWISDKFASSICQSIAAYSRQDEFEADRLASDICTSEYLASSLIKLRCVESKLARLSWEERLARLQDGDGFSQWLESELVIGEKDIFSPKIELVDKYATHPNLLDRLHALGKTSQVQIKQKEQSSIALFTNPDEIAKKLVSTIQSTALKAEGEDSKILKKWKANNLRKKIMPIQFIGITLIFVSLLVIIFQSSNNNPIPIFICSVGAIVLGLVLYWKGKLKDKFPLPVPTFKALRNNPKTLDENDDLLNYEKELEKEILNIVSATKAGKAKSNALLQQAHLYLEKCNYFQAHVASRLAYKENKKNHVALLALGIASAGLGDNQQTMSCLQLVNKQAGLQTPSQKWGVAWAMLLIGELVAAEALLTDLIKESPTSDTYHILLSVAQSRRGKVHSAIINAKAARKLNPESTEIQKHLLELLLDNASLNEAEAIITNGMQDLERDINFQLLMVRYSLLKRDINTAQLWTTKAVESGNPYNYAEIGFLYEKARHYTVAQEYFMKAIEFNHFPSVYLGLARLAFENKNTKLVKEYLTKCLQIKECKDVHKRMNREIFTASLTFWRHLIDPIPNAKAWVVKTSPMYHPKAIANISLLVYAKDKIDAESYINELITIIRDGSHNNEGTLTWTDAPKQYQPSGPVSPGIQGLFE